MKNIVVATKINVGYYNILVQSCEKNNIELIVLGLNKKWQGFTMRFKLWLQYLKTLNENEIVLMTDAYDVIILQKANKIINKYKKQKIPVFFGCQKGYISYLLFNNKHNLNAGCFIGDVGSIKQLLKICFRYQHFWKKKFHNDDQKIINYLYKNNQNFRNLCGVDINNEIFFIASENNYINPNYIIRGYIKNLKMNNGKLENKNNEEYCVLHLPANLNANIYLNYIGYNTQCIKLTTKKYQYIHFFILFKYYFFLILIIFIVLWHIIY